jgi:hypothetical protein
MAHFAHPTPLDARATRGAAPVVRWRAMSARAVLPRPGPGLVCRPAAAARPTHQCIVVRSTTHAPDPTQSRQTNGPSSHGGGRRRRRVAAHRLRELPLLGGPWQCSPHLTRRVQLYALVRAAAPGALYSRGMVETRGESAASGKRTRAQSVAGRVRCSLFGPCTITPCLGTSSIRHVVDRAERVLPPSSSEHSTLRMPRPAGGGVKTITKTAN